MGLVLRYSNRWRPIVSVPFWVGRLQGMIFEQLPENMLSISRDQVSLTPFLLLCADDSIGVSAGVGQYCP
jgi:hypothetical protein